MDRFENRKNESGSVYSYSYRDRDRDAAVHEGDYRAQDYFYGDGNRQGSYGTGQKGGSGTYGYTNRQTRRSRRNRGGSGKDAGGRTPGFGVKLIRCVVLAAVFGLVAGGVFRGVSGIRPDAADTGTVQQTESEELEQTKVSTESSENSLVVSDISDIVEEVMPSIVAITNISQTEYYNWYGLSQTYDSESCGSGILMAEDAEYLYIATNNHVVSGASSLTICFVDDSTVAAEVKGTDSGTDLAVVAVRKADLSDETLAAIRIAVTGDSDSLKTGQAAIAIGNALGYGQSVTTGVISALNRQVTVTDGESGSQVTNELIQTDAAINPGNSGGALLNSRGEVIGINSVKYTDTQVEGMGYAIPMKTAEPIINELINREAVDSSRQAFLGVTGVDVTSEVASAYQMPEGIYVVQIAEGSAAEAAGIRWGDILISLDGHALTSMDALEEQLQYYESGTQAEVTIRRAGQNGYEEITLPVTLGGRQ